MQAAEVDRVRAGGEESFVEVFARSNHLMPLDGEHDVFGDVDPEATLRSMDAIEALIAELDARLIIQHEAASVETLPAFPEPLR